MWVYQAIEPTVSILAEANAVREASKGWWSEFGG